MAGNSTAIIYINVAPQRLAINFDLIVSSNDYAMTFIFDLADRFEMPLMSSMARNKWLTCG
jgi:hypothetical protein